jgi:hypothetical protein
MDIDEFMGQRKRNLDSDVFLRWFLNNSLDNYLNQNTDTVLKSLKSDTPPSDLKLFLFEYELAHKKRKEILAVLN